LLEHLAATLAFLAGSLCAIGTRLLLFRVPVVSGTEDKASKTLESVAEVLGQQLSGLVLLMALLLCLSAGFSIVFV